MFSNTCPPCADSLGESMALRRSVDETFEKISLDMRCENKEDTRVCRPGSLIGNTGLWRKVRRDRAEAKFFERSQIR